MSNCLRGAIAGAVVAAAGVAGGATQPVVTAQAFDHLPLYFEANRGQVSPEVGFLARGRGYTFLVMPWGARMMFTKPGSDRAASPQDRVVRAGRTAAETRVVDLRFAGANPAPGMSGRDPLAGHVNYFIGSDPGQWHAGVPLHSRVQLHEVYAGVDVIFYGADQKLEYDLVFAPKADPSQVAIEFTGADKVEIDPGGELVLRVGGEEIRQHRPLIHQTLHGEFRAVSGGYRKLGPAVVGFAVGDYDRSAPLVIDPVVNYATFLGGSGLDTAWQVAIDGTGAAYIAGETTSATLPFSAGAFQTNFAGGTTNGGDAFVAKLNPEATGLEYLTYIGGKGNDGALALALDAIGNAYITGYTDSTNYPVFPASALQPKIGGKVDKVIGFPPSDGFVTKLNTNGSQLLYSTYLGGSSFDEGLGIAVDGSGNAYVTGYTDSTNFPTAHPVQGANRGGRDGFVTALNPTGTGMLFSTYLGGTNTDLAVGVALDPAGAVYVAGYTASTNFPVTNAAQALLNLVTNDLGFSDAFVVKLAPGGTQVVYATYLGGERNDFAYRVAADAAGNAYVAGWGDSLLFPSTNASAFLAQTNIAPINMDAFVAKINPVGGLVQAARFGGSGDDLAVDIKLDPSGNVYVAGFTSSPLIPLVGASGAANRANLGLHEAFVFSLSPDFSALRYSLLLGGSVEDFAFGLDVDAAGNAYLVGRTDSADFPVTGVLQPVFAGGVSDAFVARILVEPPLRIQRVGGNMVLSWPAPAPGFVLQTRQSAGTGIWLDLLITPVLNGGRYSVTLPASDATGFFRLFRP